MKDLACYTDNRLAVNQQMGPKQVPPRQIGNNFSKSLTLQTGFLHSELFFVTWMCTKMLLDTAK